MLRSILGVVAGFIVMSVLVMVLFLALAFSLGADGVFQPGSFKATAMVDFASLGISLIAALIGGWLCSLIARKRTPVLVLAGAVLVFGLISAVMNVSKPEPGLRDPTLKPFEVMEQARAKSKDTNWVGFCFPLIGAAGIMLGGGCMGCCKKK